MSDVEMASLDGDDDIDLTDIKGLLSGSEEGEINDSDSDNATSQRPQLENISTEQPMTLSFFNDGNDIVNKSIFDDIDLAKMEERANRFGLNKKSDTKTLEKEMQDLYKSLSINTEEDFRHVRLNTIHIHGTKNMKTNDIFEYFFVHEPMYLEWVNENCCNVVWKDDISAARAMVFYSKEIYGDHDSDVKMEDKGNTDIINAADINISIPSGNWRSGASHPKSDCIFLRFAKKSDKMLIGKDKLKIYSQKYVDSEDSDNMQTGIVSESLKSKLKSVHNESSDIEEKSKNPWGELCQTWGINDSQEVFGIPQNTISPNRLKSSHRKLPVRDRIGLPLPPPRYSISDRLQTEIAVEQKRHDLKLRLGKRVMPVIQVSDESSEEEECSSDEEWTTKSKIPRMRMHADDEQEKYKKNKFRSKSPQAWDDHADINAITIEVKNEFSKQSVITKEVVSENINKNKTNFEDLRSRLNRRRNSVSSDSDVSDGELRVRSSAVSKSVSKHKPSIASTVWSRLDFPQNSASKDSYSDSDDENKRRNPSSKVSSNVVAKRPGFQKGDLRSRLGKKTQFRECPLRIEVDNELYVKSDDD